MSVAPATLAAILVMAAITYATRIGGLALVRRAGLGPRATSVLEAVPGCVLVAVIAPAALTHGVPDLAAAAITLVAAMRLSLLPVVVIAIASAWGLRGLLG